MPDLPTLTVIGALIASLIAAYIAWRKAPSEITGENVRASTALVATMLEVGRTQTDTIRDQTRALKELERELSTLRAEMVRVRSQLSETALLLSDTQTRLAEANAEASAFRRGIRLLEAQVAELESDQPDGGDG
jgi:chromosome segregation ATPase